MNEVIAPGAGEAAAPGDGEAAAPSRVTAMAMPGCLCGETAVACEIATRDEVTGEPFSYLRCARCGLERLSPRPALQDMGRYYPDDYAPYDNLEPRKASAGERIKRLVYLTFHARADERPAQVRRWRWLLLVLLAPLRQHGVLAFPPPDLRRVFEFGAGVGGDLGQFRDAGWEVFGCEPSAKACDTAAARGLVLQHCGAEEAELPAGLSCVYMNNVFEHVHDPRAVLRKSHAALVAGGLVVLVVPNHRSWTARLFGAAWPGYDPPRHIWGYSPRPVTLLLESEGFRIVSIGQVFPASNCCWYNAVDGRRAPAVKWPRLRARLARILGKSLIGIGLIAAKFGHGDYIRVVARKV